MNASMIEVKTADLTGQALDWAVAIAVHGKVYVYPEGGLCPPEDTISLNEDDGTMRVNSGGFHPKDSWSPSTDWSQGGPLIEKYQVSLNPESHNGAEGSEMSERWYANVYYDGGDEYSTDFCDTALIAACRAIVGTAFGDSVKVPKELMP